MNKIPSFQIDHTNLLRGIYVSRKDYIGENVITTFDIRMKEPNKEPILGSAELHTIEHLAATFLRNNDAYADKIIYWGPMGCRTGNYFIMAGDFESKDIVELIKDTFDFIRKYEDEIPGTQARDCGSYLHHNLAMAKYESNKYIEEVLDKIESKNLIYPQ